MGRLEGKTAIITGAAGGIGRASALRFAQEGAFVYVNDVKLEAAEETVALIRKAGGAGALAAADVTDAAQVKAMVDRAAAERGRLDVIYNNAGGGLDTPTHETSIEKFHQLMALNFNAVFYGVHAALPIMMQQRSGRIVNTASSQWRNPEGRSAYAAAKGWASVAKTTKPGSPSCDHPTSSPPWVSACPTSSGPRTSTPGCWA